MHTTPPTSRRPVPLSVKLDAEEKVLLAEIAKEKSRSIHYLLREAVSEYISKEKARLDFMREARGALDHYEQTGQHVTHQEMMAWAESLNTEGELPAPSCHA